MVLVAALKESEAIADDFTCRLIMTGRNLFSNELVEVGREGELADGLFAGHTHSLMM